MENLFEELLPEIKEIAQALGVSYNRAEKIQNIFVIKIVMNGTDTARVPIIKNIRALALA